MYVCLSIIDAYMCVLMRIDPYRSKYLSMHLLVYVRVSTSVRLNMSYIYISALCSSTYGFNTPIYMSIFITLYSPVYV